MPLLFNLFKPQAQEEERSLCEFPLSATPYSFSLCFVWLQARRAPRINPRPCRSRSPFSNKASSPLAACRPLSARTLLWATSTKASSWSATRLLETTSFKLVRRRSRKRMPTNRALPLSLDLKSICLEDSMGLVTEAQGAQGRVVDRDVEQNDEQRTNSLCNALRSRHVSSNALEGVERNAG